MASLATRRPLYLDHHATTPCDPRVVEAMLPFFTADFGNAASRSHAFGWAADAAVEAARQQVALLIGATPKEIVFTSGATESNNLALFGVMQAAGATKRHLVISAIEHASVLETAAALSSAGFEVSTVGVPSDGVVRVSDVEAVLRPDTALVSIMAANNEIGTLAPLEAIGELCRGRGVYFHTDAAQAAGKIEIDVQRQHLDLVSLTAHKLYGPKGVGALYVRRRDPRVRLTPRSFGGGHERGFRSGTLPVPLIVGFGRACQLAAEVMPEEAARLLSLRTRLLSGLAGSLPGLVVHGDLERRLPGNLNVSFGELEAEPLLLSLRDFALSSGAACASATLSPSHVLRALGVPKELIHGSLRFGLGRGLTEDDIDLVVLRVVAAVSKLRDLLA
ncbi:MAG: aminotransferase class V-fold PLP-dependent enzyme [Myxococcales bacterium]|nr:aminotransferase class V-fold PLP-dependent enzyme [Myxococcales bacterium]